MNILNSFKSPLSVNLEVTDVCNMECFFCYCSTEEYKANFGKVSADEKLQNLRRIIDILHRNEIMEVRFLGGEFVLLPGWRRLISQCQEYGFFISFVSNGTVFTEKDILFLAKNCVTEGSISLHGLGEINDEITGMRGGFKKATDNLQVLLKNGIKTNVLFTPSKRNIDHFEKFAMEMIDRHSVPSIGLNRLFSDQRYESLTMKDYIGLLACVEDLQKRGYQVFFVDSFPICKVPMRYWKFMGNCSQGVSFCHIDYMGNLKNCSSLSACLGNIFEDDLPNLWRTKLANFTRLTHLPLSCRICPIFCGGGCIASREKEKLFIADEFIELPEKEKLLKTIQIVSGNYMKKAVSWLKKSWDKPRQKKFDPHFVPNQNSAYKLRQEGEELFICMVKEKGTFFLDSTGKTIINLIDGKRTITGIGLEAEKQLGFQVSTRTISDILHCLD